jgi:hypothetical protein
MVSISLVISAVAIYNALIRLSVNVCCGEPSRSFGKAFSHLPIVELMARSASFSSSLVNSSKASASQLFHRFSLVCNAVQVLAAAGGII